MTEDEIRARELEAYRQGTIEAKAELHDAWRNLAGNFALEVHHLRRELRKALKLPPPAGPDDMAATLQ